MAKSVQLPDGSWFPLKDGEDPREAVLEARKLYPEAFGVKKEEEKPSRDTSGFKAAASAGLERLKGEAALTAGKAGLMDTQAAEEYYKSRQAAAEKRFKPTEEGWTEAPWLKFKETLGGSVPYVAAPAAVGLAALTAPVSAPVAAGLGAAAAFGVNAAQFTGSNLARQMDTGKTLEETSGTAALGAAVPQAAFDTAAMALMPGVGKLFSSVGSKLTVEQARAVANQTLGRAVMDYTAKTGMAMGREGITETAQQVLERLQAGLNITDPEARKEYIESFIGGAVLAGAGAPIGRTFERRGARAQAEEADRADRAAALAQQNREAAEAAAAEEARRNSPEYATEIATKLDALQAREKELQAQIKRGTKDAPLSAEDKQANTEIGAALKALKPELKEARKEFNRTAPIRERMRLDAMTPEDYMLEQMGLQEPAAPDAAPKASPRYVIDEFGQVVEEAAPEPEATEEKAPQVNPAEAYLNQQAEIARSMGILDVPSLADFAMRDPTMAAQAVRDGVGVAGLTPQENGALLGGIRLRLKEREAELAKTEKPIPRESVEQGDLFGQRLKVGQEAGVTEKDTIAEKLNELQRQLDIAYAARANKRGSQNRDQIRNLIEQIRDLQMKAERFAEPGFGAQSKGVQDLLGSLPLVEQARQERRKSAFDYFSANRVFTEKTAPISQDVVEQRRRDVFTSLINEIKAAGRTLNNETVAGIQTEVNKILDAAVKSGEFEAADIALEALGRKWRSGSQDVQTFTKTLTPQTVSPEMLRGQLDQAFANRQRYDEDTQALLERIGDNLGPVANNPERAELVSNWLYRATSGTPDASLAAEVKAELDALDRAGRGEEYAIETRETPWGTAEKPVIRGQQGELPGRMLPKAVAPATRGEVREGKAVQVDAEGNVVEPAKMVERGGKFVPETPTKLVEPAKASTAFETAAQFMKFLASDAVKMMRAEMGLAADTASAMHKRVELFQKKYEAIIAGANKRIEALKAKKQELEALKKTEAETVGMMIREAEANLAKLQTRLDEELAGLQIEYVQAHVQFERSAAESEAVAAQLADNIAKFNNEDAEYVEAAKRLATLKAEAARITQAIAMRLQSNKETGANVQTLDATREQIIKSINELRSKTDRTNPTMLQFLQTAMELELRQQAAEKQLARDGRALLDAGMALEVAAKEQAENPKVQKQLAEANTRIAKALGVKESKLPGTLAEIDKQIAETDSEIKKAQEEAAAAKQRLEPKPEAPAEGTLVKSPLTPLSAAEREDIAKKDREKLERFEATTARLNAIPGQRIDFSKRREMLNVVGAANKDFAQLDQDIADAQDAIEQVQTAAALAEEEAGPLRAELAKYKTRRSPKSVALANRVDQLEARIKTAKEREAQLEADIKTANNRKERLQKAYDRAVAATSNDPEIVAKVNEGINARIEKLQRQLEKNEPLAKQTKGKNGKPLSKNTVNKRKARVAAYKRELASLEALRGNRLGLERIPVGGKAAPTLSRAKPTQTEAEQFAAEEERKGNYDALTKEINRLQKRYDAAVAAGQPKAPALIKAKIDAAKAERARFAPKKVGKVSAASRTQSAAPGKLRAGTAESKAQPGKAANRIEEQRTVEMPTVKAAMEEANTFVQRVESGKDKATLDEDFRNQNLSTQAAVIAALADNVQRYSREVSRLESEVDRLETSLEKASKTESMSTRAQLGAVRKQLEQYRTALTNAEIQQAKFEAALPEAPTLEGETVSDIEGGEMTGNAPRTSSMSAIDDEYYGDEMLRGTSGANDTPLKQRSVSLLETGDMAGTVSSIGQTTSNPVAARVAAKIAPILEANGVTVSLVDRTTPSEPDAPGMITKDGKRVRINSATGVSEESVMHEGVHAATMFELDKPDSQLTPDQRAAKAELNQMMEQVKADPAFDNTVIKDGDIHEFVAEGNSSRAVQAYMRKQKAPDNRTLWQKFKEAVLRLLGVKVPAQGNMLDRFLDLSEFFMAAKADPNAQVAGPKLRKTAPGVATPAMDALADKLLEGKKSFGEKFGSSPALALEMEVVDMRAAGRKALLTGDKDSATQAIYAILKADQKMPMVYTTLSNGPLELYKDDKGLTGIRSTGKNSGMDVFKAVSALPVADKRKMAVAQMYMVAQRALNKGLPKLDLGALGVTEADLRAVLAEADSDPALKRGLENVRGVYNAYNKGLIDFNVATGALTKEQGEKLNRAGDYVPFYRVDANGKASLVFDDDVMVSIGDIRRQPYLAQLKGGETKLLPLDEAIFRNTTLLVDKALTNMATKEFAYAMQDIGAPAKKMQIKKGSGPDNAAVLRFTQQPDPADPKDDGKRWIMLDTGGTVAEGVPTALLVKSVEGTHLPLPAFFKLAGAASDLLRSGVTRMPPYIFRQLLRDPMAATFTGGLNYNPLTAVFKAGKQFVSSVRGGNELEAKLLEKGLIQSGIFTGDADDIAKIAKQIVGSNNMGAIDTVFAALDKAAIRADAATRALVYENALKNGLSEVEADMMTMESMNFYKRGLSPSVQYAARMIPFLNAQIQGLNVLYKAATGKMPFEERQRIQRKFFGNAALLVAAGLVYAMAMEDDEYFRNAKPRDKYSNFFLPTPFTDEPLKLPIPYEAGYFFSMAVAAVDGMKAETSTKEQFKALRDMFVGSIPGASSMFVPQLVKPIAEVWANKNFMSGNAIESQRMQGLDVTERYNVQTTELAKMLSKALPMLSPVQIEHIARGYLGVLPIAVAGAANDLFGPETKGGEAMDKRASDLPVLGSMFQKKYGGGDSDTVYDVANNALQVRRTFNAMLKEGRREDALEYRKDNLVAFQSVGAAETYQQIVGRINTELRRVENRRDLTGSEKASRREQLEKAKDDAAKRFLTVVRRLEDRTTPQ